MAKTPRGFRIYRTALLLIICAVLATVSAGSAVGATYYITMTGNDSNSGSSSSPWRTLQHAIETVNPGDVVHVANGTYAGALVMDHVATVLNPTRFIADGPSVVIDRPGPTYHADFFEVGLSENVRFSGFILDGATFVVPPGKHGRHVFQNRTRNIEWINCQFLNSPSKAILAPNSPGTKLIGCTFRNNARTTITHTIYFAQSDAASYQQRNIEIRNCVLYGNGENPVQFHPRTTSPANDNQARDCIIDSNIFYGDVGPFLMLFSCSNFTITNNLFYNCRSSHIIRLWGQATGPNFGPASKNNVIANNIIINPNGKAINFSRDPGSTGEMTSGNVVFNNMLMGNTDALSATDGATLADQFIDLSSNIMSAWSDQLLRDLFVNVQGRGTGNDIVLTDAHLKSGSRAINLGKLTYMGKLAPTIDIEGALRNLPPPDAGSYEYGASGNPQAPLPPTNVRVTGSPPNCANVLWNAATGLDVAGYTLYYGLQSVAQGQATQYSNSVNVGNVTSRQQCGLSPGRWYFALRTYNSPNQLSGYSSEVSLVVDTSAPTLSGRNPASGAVNVALNAKVYFTLQDAVAGVDTNGVTVLINGTPRQRTFFGNPSSYAVVCDPRGLPSNSLVTVAVTARDLAPTPNTLNTSWSFATQDTTGSAVDVTPPAITGQYPVNGATDVASNTAIFFVLSDGQSGVDRNSVTVRINGVAPASQVFNGNPQRYAVICQPASLLPAGAPVNVTVSARDLSQSPNLMNAGWSFTTWSADSSDSSPPAVSGRNPVNGATGVPPTTNISFVVWDTGLGVDASSVRVTINGQAPGSTSFYGLRSGYTVVCVPADTLPLGSTVSVSMTASDLAVPPHTVTTSWSFATDDTTVTRPDGAPPLLSGANPADGDINVPRDTKIFFVITDAQTGVDTNTVSVLVNGIPPARTFFYGVPSSYAVVCEMGSLLPANSIISVSATAQDLSGPPNVVSAMWSFTTTDTTSVPVDVNPPVLSGAAPGDGDVNIDPDTDVIVVLSDAGSGIDTSSVLLLINGVPPRTRTFFGIPSTYIVRCAPATTLPSGSLINVQLSASDVAVPSNTMSTGWSFTTQSAGGAPDNAPPTLSSIAPLPNSSGVDPRAKIRITVSDNSGIDPATIELRYNDEIVPASVAMTDTTQRTALVEYEDRAGFPYGTSVAVGIVACDRSGNCATFQYSFSVAVDPALMASAGAIVPDGYWAEDPSRPLEVQDLPTGWMVRIFDTNGTEVRSFKNTEQAFLDWTWDFENDHGNRVARSLYLIRVLDGTGAQRRSGRFIVQSQ